MKFPVDLLADVCQTELEQLAHKYMSNLLHSNPDSPEHLTLSDSTQVTIDISSVGFIPLYGSSDKQRILALFSPSDPLTAVALYLLDQWWAVDNILKTSDPARDGAMEVETLGERIVLYILNRVIYRAKEMSRSEELPFLCHGEKDHAKILWNNGEAVGFYSVKPSGSFCNSFSTRSYQLPVMDSIFVRKGQRGKGFGLQMLEDYVLSFKEDCLGLRYPLTKSMYKVCERYLCQYPEDGDLLWEVESIGGPNQRTNIARKIQAMDQSAVSKSLSFTEESLVITEMTQTEVVMEAITTQIKKAESMECTVEIVEEVTEVVLNATKEAEVPLTARGRSSGSKRMKMGEKIADDKSEKVIRIEDIEAETPGQDQISAEADTELHNDLVQTEVTFSVALDEQGEDVVDTAPEEEAATMTDPPATALAPQDIEEADVTLAPANKEPQVQDDAPQDLITSCDSLITVENVASEILETEEDTAMLVACEEALEVHKEAETLDKVGDGTQWDTDEKSEEKVIQHEVSLPTHTTSENGEAKRTGRTIVEAIKTVQSKTPQRRSTRHSKQEEGVKKETTAQDRGIILRGRTVLNAPTPKRKYTRRSQKICEELEKEVDEAAEENKVSTYEVVELAVTEGEEQEGMSYIKEDEVAVEELTEAKQQLDDDELRNEVDTEKQQQPGEDDTVMRSTELPHTAESALTKEDKDEKVRDESEKEQKGEKVETSVIQARQEVADDEIEEAPVVQKRALRIRGKVSPIPKPTKQSKMHQKQDGEHTDMADLGAGCSASEEKADAQATDKQMEEHHQDEQKTVDKTEYMISTRELAVMEEDTVPKAEEAVEDVIPSTVIPSAEVNMEESKEVLEEEETETVLVMVAENKQEPSDDTASEIVIPDTVLSEAVVPEAKEPQEEDTGSEIPKLQKATVILVDIKTTCHHLTVKEVIDGECAALEKHQEEKDQSADATAQTETVEKEELEGDNNEKEKEESANVDEGKGETETVNASCESTSRTNRQEEEEDTGEVDEAETGTGEVEAEMESVARDSVILTVPVEGKHCPVPEICADREADVPVGDTAKENLLPVEVEGALSLEEEESPVVETRSLRSGPKRSSATPKCKTTRSKKQVDALEAENSEEEEKEEEEETAVTTRTLRRGRLSASDAPKGKSRRSHKQIQEEEQKVEEESKSVEETGVEEEEAAKEAAVEKTDKEIEEEVKGVIVEKGKEEAASVREDLDMEEGEAATEQRKDVVETCAEMEEEASVEESDERKSVMEAEEVELPTVTLTRSMRSGGKMSKAPPKIRSRRSKKLQGEEEGESAEKGTDGNESPVGTRILRGGRKSVRRSHKQLQYEEGGPKESAEELEVEEEVEAELGSAKEPPTEGDEGKAPEDITEVENEKLVAIEVEKRESTKGTVTMTEDEENSAAADDSIQEGEADTPLPKPASDSSGLPEEEEGVDDKVGAVTMHVREEGAAQEEEAKSIIDEEEATVTETKTRRSRKQAVKATPRTKLARGRPKKDQVEEQDTLERQEEEPTVQARVLRRGRKFIPVAQKFTTKTTHKQLQEGETEGEDGGEESAAVEEREEEEGQQQVIDPENEESLGGRETTEQVENLEAAMEMETADKAVIQDTPEEGEAQKTDEDTEASVEQHANEGKTLDVAEEAVTTQDIVEGEQSTSTCEGEILSTPKEDEAKGVSEEEEAPVIERILRSGEKRLRATTRSTTTKRQDDEQEEDAAGEKSIEEDEAAIQTRVLRKGRRSAAAATRRKSKRARTQCQTDEEEEEETTPAEETGGEEEARHDLPEEEEGKSIEMEKDKDVEEEEGESAAVGECAVDSDAEQMKDVLTEEAAFEEKDNIVEAVDETGTDTVHISSAEVEETEQTQQQEEETPEEEEVHQSTDDSPRRSVRKRPRVDYREEKEEGGENEAATDKEEDEKMESDKDKDTKKAKCSTDDLKEKPDTLKVVLDTDEEEEEAGVSQEAEEDEQNMSEEELEPVVIGKRVLRGRTVPSVIVTPHSKSTRASAEVQKAQIAVSGEVEKAESAEGTVTMTKEEENTATDDDSVQEGDKDTPLPKPASDSSGLPPSEDEATPSAEENESDEMVPQLSDLQRVTVVLVDLQKTHCDFQEETFLKDTSESQEEEPAVQARVLRRGREFIPVAQKFTTKTTHKQLQEGETEGEDGGEESAAVEEREEEEGQQQVIDPENEESLGGRETTEQVENLEAAMEMETADKAVIQDTPEEGEAQKTDEDTEASVEQHANEGKTLDVAEEAVTTQDIVEGEQSTSTCEGEILSTPKEDEAKGVSEEEEAPVIERILRSGEKRLRATTRSTTTKRQDDKQDEDAAGEKSIEEDEAAIQTRVLRKGRRSAAAATRRKSKRARTQCQTDEEEEEETTPAEETGGEEEARHDLPEEEEGKSIEMVKDEDVEEEEGESAAVGESAVDSDAEQMKDVSTEEAAFEEKDNIVEAADETGTDTVHISSAEVEETEQTQQQEEETPEEEEVHQSTDDSPRRSVRKRPRVDYREEEEEGGENEAATDKEGGEKMDLDKDKDTKKAKCSADDLKEKPDTLKVVFDTDEEEEEAGVSQEAEEDEQNMSEEELEPVVIGKRVLRGRTVPSVIVTPHSKSTRTSAEVQSLSDGQKCPRSAQKRKSTEVTPNRRSKRLSRV